MSESTAVAAPAEAAAQEAISEAGTQVAPVPATTEPAPAAALAVADTELPAPARHPARYNGEGELAGITPNENGLIVGEYWQQGDAFLFEPIESGRIFEVSDEDIIRLSAASFA